MVSRNGKPCRKYTINRMGDRYLIDVHKFTPLSVLCTNINFSGSDRDEPAICSKFGCKVKISKTEQLFGNTCIHHQKEKK